MAGTLGWGAVDQAPTWVLQSEAGIFHVIFTLFELVSGPGWHSARCPRQVWVYCRGGVWTGRRRTGPGTAAEGWSSAAPRASSWWPGPPAAYQHLFSLHHPCSLLFQLRRYAGSGSTTDPIFSDDICHNCIFSSILRNDEVLCII